MTLSQLRYLTALDDHRHFVRAAEACFVSQPTLSMQIQKLESELGVELFNRRVKPLQPTEVGALLVAQARKVLRESARLKEIVGEASDILAGELHLGIIPTLSPYLLPLVTATFCRRYPNIELVLAELTTPQLREALLKDRIDAGLVATAEEGDGLDALPLFDEPFFAFISPEHRLADQARIDPQSLRLEDMWLLDEGHCFRDQVIELCSESSHACGLSRSVRFESGHLDTLRKMVERSGGMTLLPYLATLYLQEAQERFVKPLQPAPSRRVALLYPQDNYLRRARLRAFTEVLLESLPEGIVRLQAPPRSFVTNNRA